MLEPLLMRVLACTSLTLLLPIFAPEMALAGENRIELQNLAARVIVVAQARQDIDVRVKSGPRNMPQVTLRRQGDRVIVNGNVGGHSQSCGGGGGSLFAFTLGDRNVTTVRVAGMGQVNLSELPTVYVYGPQDLEIVSTGAVYGNVSETGSLKLNLHGCGDWNVGPVRGSLTLLSNGSGDTHAASAGDSEIISAGSGDVSIGAVRSLKLSQSGSGDVTVGSVGGTLSAATAGSGDVSIGAVNGPVEISVAGSGDVVVAKGRSPTLKIALAGSGDVHFGGEAKMVEAAVVGSGDIYVARATGTVQKKVLGSGDIDIGGQ
ncbi:GIN domain-containing protein [Asticcacaulis sp.]|uniref:GIN domain-containing protein n=1 Tax=Asticcacaulis sp. TaxID=1872648 RepID=UPI00391A66FE